MATNIAPISTFPEVTDLLTGDEDLPLVQDGVTKRIKAFRALSFTLPEWRGELVYALDAVVSYGGVLYKSLIALNEGNTPGPGSAFWLRTGLTPSIDVQGDNLNHQDGRFVKINGLTYYQDWAPYGHRLTVIDPTDFSVVSSAVYDTYASGTSGLISAINSVAAGLIITLASGGQISIDAPLRAVLTGLGGKSSGAPGTGAYSHVFIGQYGLLPGQAYEVYDSTMALRKQCYVTETGLVHNGEEGPVGDPVIVQGSVDASSWHTGLLTGDVYMRTSEDGGTTWSASVRILGEDGESGKFTNFKFAKNSSPTSAPAYTPNADNPGANWYDGPQTLGSGEFQWFIKSDWRDTVRLTVWTAPARLSGEPGATGANGTNNAPVYLYKRSASVPSGPTTTSTYTFSTGILTGHDGGWSQTIPAVNGDPCYAIAATASSNTNTDTILASEWSSPVKMVQDGTDGTNGLNNAAIKLFKRSSTTPAVPTTTSTYTFATGVLSGHDGGWTQSDPADDGLPLWITSAVAISSGSTDTIAAGEWSTPVQYLAPQPVSPGETDLIARYTFDDIADMPFTAVPPSTDASWVVAGGTLSGGAFTKSLASGWNNSGLVSKYQIEAGAKASFVYDNNYVFMGLKESSPSSPAYPGMDFAIHSNNGSPQLYAAGAFSANGGTCVNGDVLSILYDGLNVKILKNSTELGGYYVGPGKSYYAMMEVYTSADVVSGVSFFTGGLTYKSDFSSGLDGWTATGGTGSLAASNGTFVLLNPIGGTYMTKNPSWAPGYFILRIKQSAGTLDTLRVDISGAGVTKIGPADLSLSRGYKTYIFSFSGGIATAVNILTVSYGSLPSELTGDWIYIGAGYQSAISDTSRNAGKMFLRNVTPTTGRTGKALNFGGVGWGRADRQHLPTTGDYDASWWAKLDALPGATKRMVSQGINWGVNSSNQWDIQGYVASADTLPHKWGVSVVGSVATVFKDGFKVWSGADPIRPTATLTDFGATTGGTDYWPGWIDEFRAYSRGLIEAEDRYLYVNPGGTNANQITQQIAKQTAVYRGTMRPASPNEGDWYLDITASQCVVRGWTSSQGWFVDSDKGHVASALDDIWAHLSSSPGNSAPPGFTWLSNFMSDNVFTITLAAKIIKSLNWASGGSGGANGTSRTTIDLNGSKILQEWKDASGNFYQLEVSSTNGFRITRGGVTLISADPTTGVTTLGDVSGKNVQYIPGVGLTLGGTDLRFGTYTQWDETRGMLFSDSDLNSPIAPGANLTSIGGSSLINPLTGKSGQHFHLMLRQEATAPFGNNPSYLSLTSGFITGDLETIGTFTISYTSGSTNVTITDASNLIEVGDVVSSGSLTGLTTDSGALRWNVIGDISGSSSRTAYLYYPATSTGSASFSVKRPYLTIAGAFEGAISATNPIRGKKTAVIGDLLPRYTAGTSDASWLGRPSKRWSKGYINHLNMSLDLYADNAAALSGGLVAGDLYRQSTGLVAIVF